MKSEKVMPTGLSRDAGGKDEPKSIRTESPPGRLFESNPEWRDYCLLSLNQLWRYVWLRLRLFFLWRAWASGAELGSSCQNYSGRRYCWWCGDFGSRLWNEMKTWPFWTQRLMERGGGSGVVYRCCQIFNTAAKEIIFYLVWMQSELNSLKVYAVQNNDYSIFSQWILGGYGDGWCQMLYSIFVTFFCKMLRFEVIQE